MGMIAELLGIKYRYRSAVTGKFVKKEYADKHPETTVREKISA